MRISRFVLAIVILLSAALFACSPTVRRTADQPEGVRAADLHGEWYRVEGEHAQVVTFEPDGTGFRYAAYVAALRGEAPGVGPPRAFKYSVTRNNVRLDFEDETDVTLVVDSVTGDQLRISAPSTDDWAGTWTADFE